MRQAGRQEGSMEGREEEIENFHSASFNSGGTNPSAMETLWEGISQT